MVGLVGAGGHVAKQGNYFMRWLSLVALTTVLSGVLSGCAVPPAITIASLVADVATYASTGKTVTDHGISLVLGQDCALLRGLEGKICLEPDPADRFAAALAYTADPEVTPRPAGRVSDRGLDALSYLGDSLGRAG